VRLALDNHYSPRIASRLRDKGHDGDAVIERGWQTESDDALLVLCHDDGRALVTNNVGDFVVIARRWAVEGRSHAGLIFTSDASLARSRDTIGRYVQLLDRLLKALPDDAALAGQIRWL
jgi:hypothetical protein